MSSKKPTIKEIGNFSTATAAVSFVVGTLLFIGFYFFEIVACVSVGFVYLFLAFCGNSILLLVLLFSLIRHRNNPNYIVGKILILLANLPIAVFYFYLIITKIQHTSPF